jgi:hypothetical protein
VCWVSGCLEWFDADVPGQELCDAVYRMIGDAIEHSVQVRFRIEAIQFGGLCRIPDYAEPTTQAAFSTRVSR